MPPPIRRRGHAVVAKRLLAGAKYQSQLCRALSTEPEFRVCFLAAGSGPHLLIHACPELADSGLKIRLHFVSEMMVSRRSVCKPRYATRPASLMGARANLGLINCVYVPESVATWANLAPGKFTGGVPSWPGVTVVDGVRLKLIDVLPSTGDCDVVPTVDSRP